MKIDDLIDIGYSFDKTTGGKLEDNLNVLESPFHSQLTVNYIKIKSREDYMSLDALDGCYKRHDKDYYEKLRLDTLSQIEKMDNLVEINKLVKERSAELADAAYYIEYNRRHFHSVRIAIMIDTCHNMMVNGATLTEILKYVPYTHAADIYQLGEKYLGIKLELSPEEQRLVEEDKMASSEESDSQKIDLSKMIQAETVKTEIPHRDEDTGPWKISCGGNMHEGSAYEVAKIYTGLNVQYPFYNGSLKLKYADSFEEIVAVCLSNPDTFCVDGLEKFYGLPEYELLRNLKEKMMGKQ